MYISKLVYNGIKNRRPGDNFDSNTTSSPSQLYGFSSSALDPTPSHFKGTGSHAVVARAIPCSLYVKAGDRSLDH